MSKERLEEFREEIDFLDDSADMEDYHRFIDTLKNLYEDGDLDWIYRYAKEQAERVGELESQRKEDSHDFVNRIIGENKRYRELLEKMNDKRFEKKEVDGHEFIIECFKALNKFQALEREK